MLQSPLLFGCINNAKIINTDLGLSSGSGFEKVWNRQTGQQPDDRDNDHDFDEGKREFTTVHGLHNFLFYLSLRL